MDRARLSTIITLAIAALIAVMWVTVQGTPALVVSIVGGVAIAISSIALRSTPPNE